ncbi:hypothetical protein [Spirosoma rhododendri]|uniref:Uncharacterized protein n=1 Tax=Spirosoma rhododendri TaxID=2728024 RepID=A0A7L5DNG5_9BACT|nr:hypothetical protein [Spirosoma rhododendri]QJD78723.1 hypothetical protein HH216_09995 [Spirosoma rhododendri]
MKKQFSIKTINVVKGNIATAAKAESNNLLKFLKPADCCPTADFTGLIKPVFSL